jgi:hypothetical protein
LRKEEVKKHKKENRNVGKVKRKKYRKKSTKAFPTYSIIQKPNIFSSKSANISKQSKRKKEN